MKNIMTVSAATLGTICIAYYMLCGSIYSFSLSGLWIWLVSGIILYFFCLWRHIVEPLISEKYYLIYRCVKKIFLTVLTVFLLAFTVFEILLISKWHEGCDNENLNNVDAVIVLGSAVEYDKPGETLKERIDKAFEIINRIPDATIIVCGGLGDEDIITEAACIKRELVALGILADNILTEELSTSTVENFLYASELLNEDMKSIAVITSGFHQFRANIIGKKFLNEKNLIPVSSPCISLQLPRYMVREFAAFVKGVIEGDI